MRPSILWLAVATSLLASRPATAWNGPGHMTVAKVAFDGLDAATRKKARELLTHHPHYESYLKKNRPPNVEEEEWVFLRAATWPDGVRPPLKPELPDPAVVKFHRPDDHFANLPVDIKDATPEFTAKVRSLPDAHDVLCALKQRAMELELKTASPEDKAVALCWMLHLVGDIHQPLHCASLYVENRFPPPHGDFGGNSVGVRVNNQKVKLHSYWDALLAVTGDEAAEFKDTKEYAEEAYKVACLAADRVSKANPRDGLDELKKGMAYKYW